MLYTTTITMYTYTVNIENVYIYTFIHSLMWVVFGQNCVNFTIFSIYKHLCDCYNIAKKEKLYEKLVLSYKGGACVQRPMPLDMLRCGHVSTLGHVPVS